MKVALILCDIDSDEENIEPYKSIELGSYEYVNCYLSSISSLLENGKWGSRFPIMVESLDAKTKIGPGTAEELLSELDVIQEELKKLPPSKIDCEDIAEESTWMLEAPFDTSADNIYDYFLTLEDTNLTKTFYDYAIEAVEET